MRAPSPPSPPAVVRMSIPNVAGMKALTETVKTIENLVQIPGAPRSVL